MKHRWAAFGLVCLALAPSGCGAASPHTSPIAEGALPITPGARLYFESADPRGPRQMTVAILGTNPSLSFELACGHVEPARALASPTTGVVDSTTLASGRDVYAIDHCDRPAQHEGDGLPAFLVSTHALEALDRHERTTLRVEDHGSLVALVPIGHETLSVRVDGRATPVDTVHARASGIDLWVADVGTPVVVREIDHDRGFTLSGIDTRDAATPHARP